MQRRFSENVGITDVQRCSLKLDTFFKKKKTDTHDIFWPVKLFVNKKEENLYPEMFSDRHIFKQKRKKTDIQKCSLTVTHILTKKKSS
jgi:hypothetical protein